MITDVAGRIRNIQVPASKPLLPLFEVINNAMEAIADVSELHGLIEVEVIREETLLDRHLADITSFAVRDNGIGFDERNYEEFNRSDTTYKTGRGGKGIGRFMWLVAFDRAEVESVYHTDGQAICRRFTFCPRGSGIEGHSCGNAPDKPRETTVRLIGYKERYRKQVSKEGTLVLKQLDILRRRE